MATVANVAAFLTTQMNTLLNNQGGQVQTLLNANVFGGQRRAYVANLVLASQASASLIALTRIPLGSTILSITETTDTSLSTASISYGNTNSVTKYAGIHTLTATNTPTPRGTAGTTEGCVGIPITTGYDCVTGLASSYTRAGTGGGSGYDDIVLSVTVAALPASGNLTVVIETLEV